MPDPGPGFSRLCPACGRRVPRSVAVCRCGAEVPELAGAGPPAQEPSRRGVTLVNLAAGMLLLGALAATGYRAFTRSPAAEPMARAVRRGGDAAFLPMPPEGGPPLPLAPGPAAGEAPSADYAPANRAVASGHRSVRRVCHRLPGRRQPRGRRDAQRPGTGAAGRRAAGRGSRRPANPSARVRRLGSLNGPAASGRVSRGPARSQARAASPECQRRRPTRSLERQIVAAARAGAPKCSRDRDRRPSIP